MTAVASLHGHRGEVLCLSPGESPTRALSGGSDGTIRLWDWPRSNRSGRCLIAGRGDVTAVTSSTTEPHRVFAALGSNVLEFDLRQERLVVENTLWRMSWSSSSEDEVNSLAVNSKGTHLAGCDDAGDIAVMDLRVGAGGTRTDLLRWRKFRRRHQNIASKVVFRPEKTWELVSSSLDCSILRWDFNRGRVLSEVNLTAPLEEASNEMVNPPFVHSLALEPTRQGRVAAATGSGHLLVLDMGASSPICARGTGVHAAAAAAVCWLSVSTLVSGGVDSKLGVWQCDEKSNLHAIHQCRLPYKVNDLAPVQSQAVLVATQSPVLTVVDFDKFVSSK